MNKKSKNQIKNFEDTYVNFSGHPATMWFRGVLQSLDVEFNPSIGLKISIGQFLERFIFIQSEIIAQKRAEQAIQEINRKLKKVQINHITLTKKAEENARLFLRFFGAVGSQTYSELRSAYVNQMVTFFRTRYSAKDNKQFYQQLLFRLTINHFAILSFSRDYLGEDKGTQFENSKVLTEVLMKEFKTRKGMPEALIRGIIRDLDSIGLLNDWQSSSWGGDIHGLSVTDLGRELLAQTKE